jgi:dephospho-CoA kinase
MITFGLTGNIACGKSTISRTFRAHGIPMVDADLVAREVVEPHSFGLQALVLLFGEDILQSTGELDRAKLAQLVFHHPNSEERKANMISLNRLMAPLIQETSLGHIRKFHSQGNPIVGYDGAMLIENGHADHFRPLIVVHCQPEQQLERLLKRGAGDRPLTRAEAMDRIQAQMPSSQKVALADYVIDTSGTLEESVKQTEIIIHQLKGV